MSEWKEYRLGDWMQFNPIRTLKKNTIARKITMDKLIPHSKQIYDFDYSPYAGGSKFQNHDTIMARITPCLENGKHAYVSLLDDGEVAYGSTEYIVMCGKKGVSSDEFVYYFTKSKKFQDTAVKSMVGSSGRQRAQVDVLKNMVCLLPDLNSQHKIVSILSSFDSKIECNRKICANLEAQAQALFKHWFVDFAPFKDGKFVESELGLIPEGWRVGTLGELGDIVGGATPSKSNPAYYTKKGIPWLTPKDLSNKLLKFTSRGKIDITQEGYRSCSAKILPKGSVLFSSRAPIGYLTIAKNDLCTNQGFKSVVPQYAGTAYIYYLLKLNTKRIESMSTGTTFKEASSALMKSVAVIVPPKELINQFEKAVKGIFEEQEVSEKEASSLADLRDTLLPKLMSGQIEL